MSTKIDWRSQSTHWMTSPHWTDLENNDFLLCKSHAPDLTSTIWIRSSGSTSSRSRWFAISKAAFLASAEGVNTHLGVSKNDVWLKSIPDFHVGGLSIYARSFLAGFQVVEQSEWSAQSFLECIESQNVTLSSLVPTQIYDLVGLGKKMQGSLRAIVVGGDALSEDLYFRARDLGFPLLPSYGSTETCSQIATASLESLRGERFPRMQFLNHAKVTQTPKGTLKVYSESLFTGELRISHCGDVDWLPRKEPHFLTKDLAELQNGELVRATRPESLLKVSGELVSLAALRQSFTAIAFRLGLDQKQWELVAVPHERRGQEIILMTTCGLDVASAVAADFNKDQKSLSRIRAIYYVEEIPRSDLGKPQLSKLFESLGYLDSSV